MRQQEMSDDQYHQLDLQLQRILSHLTNELGGEATEGNVHRQLSEIRNSIRTLQAHIMGSPENPGIVMRLDRLEVAEKARGKVNSAALFALVGLVVKACWDLLVT